MKIQFNPDLNYQHDAINAVLGVFEGQEARQKNFSVPTIKQAQMEMLSEQSDLGIGNKKELLDD
ncbi:MAG: hypothetical protein R8M38_00690, partial [Mariprofundaceae bacterium]